MAGGDAGGPRRPGPLPRVRAGRARSSSCPVSREWTRIGRSLAADIRFDDATVSRRHALVASEEGGVRVLDDRSLNGIQVNGRRVEWSPLDRRRRARRSAATRCTSWTPCPRPHSRAAPAALTRVATCIVSACMADTIAVLSLKGGTGKTTTVRTLADVLRRVGLDVLAVDLDPQGNLSDYFDVPPDAAPTRRRRARGRRQGQGRDPRRDRPRDAQPGRGRARAVGQDGPRGRAQEGAQGRAQEPTT